MNLEIAAAATLNITGPVFSNAGLWSGSTSITFANTVSAVGIATNTPSDPFCTGYTGSGKSTYLLAGQPTSGNAPLTMPLLGTNSDPAAAEALINLPPTAYAMGTAAAYSATGAVYLANNADLYLTNFPNGTNRGALTPRGTNMILYYQDAANGPGNYLTRIRYDFYLITNRGGSPTILSTNFVTATNSPNNFTNIIYAGYSFVTNVLFYDWREGWNGGSGVLPGPKGKAVQAVQINVASFNAWLFGTNMYGGTNVNGGQSYNAQCLSSSHKSHPIDSIYVYNAIPLTSTTLPAVRLVNGAMLPSQTAPYGFTVVTPMPMYVLGNYNVSNNLGSSLGQNSTTYTWPAALMGDAITILSGNWKDSTTTQLPTATATTVNAAFLAGIVQSTNLMYSGGVENFLRLLESWGSSSYLWYNGSIVAMFPSQYATNFWQQTGNYYAAPGRKWAFDTNFMNLNRLPPLTPILLTCSNPPVITTQPQSQTVASGNTAIFTVTAWGSGLLAYQWSFMGTNIAGATNASLTLTNVQLSQAGTYAVLVTNTYGSILSSSAVLTVTTTPPTIQAQPTNQTVFVNGTATFGITATGSLPLSYQWSFNGTNIDGATNASLTLVNVQTNQAGNYAVLVTNAFDSILSSNAALNVIAVPPTILTQPTNQTVFVYSNVTFNVTANGSSPLSYQWSFNGTNIDGATNITLALTNVQPVQAGNYAVQVTNPYGSTNSTNAALVVVAQPTILVQPANQTLIDGNTAVFSVTAVGFSPLSYQWQFNGTNVDGATNPSLTLDSVNTNNNGSYQVIVTNSYGSVTSSIATLTVTRSLVVAWGEKDFGETNVPADLKNVTAISAGYFHNLALQDNGTVVAWGYNAYGQTNVPAGLTNVAAIAGGGYFSLALQANGNVVGWGDNGYGQINIPPNLANTVAITAGYYHSLALQANGTVVAWGYNAYGQTNVPVGLMNVLAIAAGGYHSLALQANGTVVAWGHNGYGQTDVPAGLTNIVAIAAGQFHSLALQANGTVVGWGEGDSGQTNVPAGLTNVVAIAACGYFSLALQANGTVVGWGDNFYGEINIPASLTNVVAIAAGFFHSLALENDGSPVILRQTASQTALNGATVLFNVTTVGRSPLSYQWQKDGTNLADGGNVSGTTTAALTLTNVQTNDVGTYIVVVTNDFGSITSSNAVLTLLVPPSIITQPAGCTDIVGATANFNVVVDGTAPLLYQWQSNGTNLVGATNATLTLNNITLDQVGTYSVTVTNLVGGVTSSNAVLWVYASAAPMLNGCSFSSCNGFEFQVVGVPGFNYAVQESTNLIDWVSLITNASPFIFMDANATNSPQQFYRSLYVP